MHGKLWVISIITSFFLESINNLEIKHEVLHPTPVAMATGPGNSRSHAILTWFPTLQSGRVRSPGHVGTHCTHL